MSTLRFQAPSHSPLTCSSKQSCSRWQGTRNTILKHSTDRTCRPHPLASSSSRNAKFYIDTLRDSTTLIVESSIILYHPKPLGHGKIPRTKRNHFSSLLLLLLVVDASSKEHKKNLRSQYMATSTHLLYLDSWLPPFGKMPDGVFRLLLLLTLESLEDGGTYTLGQPQQYHRLFSLLLLLLLLLLRLTQCVPTTMLERLQSQIIISTTLCVAIFHTKKIRKGIHTQFWRSRILK